MNWRKRRMGQIRKVLGGGGERRVGQTPQSSLLILNSTGNYRGIKWGEVAFTNSKLSIKLMII